MKDDTDGAPCPAAGMQVSKFSWFQAWLVPLRVSDLRPWQVASGLGTAFLQGVEVSP